MMTDRFMQLGYNHAIDGWPYLWHLDRERMSDEEIRSYARGYLLSRPEGRAAEQKQYPGNLIPARRDAGDDANLVAFLKLILKCFGG